MAYDGENVTAEDLRIAKSHCTTCAGCAAFVSGLARIRQVPAPRASEAAIDRAMVAVKREADAQAAAAAKADRDAAEGIGADDQSAPARARHDRSWVAWGGWAAAAAAILIAVGVITVNGVRYMSTPADEMASQTGSVQEWSAAPTAPGAGSAEMQDSASKAQLRGEAPAYVLFQGFVYLVAEKSQPIEQDATRQGTLTSDLGTGTIAERVVFAGDAPGSIVVAEDERTGYPATAVVRMLDRKPFGLMSSSFTQYGVWPALPMGMTQPTAEDGSPVFESAGKDDSGVEVFVLPGTEPGTGFAIGPNTEADDPAGGNPGWTWWAPINY